MDKVSKAVLRYLFHEYLKAPSVLYSINSVTDAHHADAVLVTDYLMERGWIRERWVHLNNQVACRITVEGIEEINASWIDVKLREIMTALVDAGGRKSLMQIFENKIQEYPIALDIVYQLEKRSLVYMIHEHGEISVQLTSEGWRYSEKSGKSMYTLMAVA